MPKKQTAEELAAEGELQVRRFQEVARKLGCDEDEAAFDAKLATIAKQKPKEGVESASPPTK